MLVARLRTLRYRRRRRKDVGLGAGHEAHEHQHVTGRQRPGGGRSAAEEARSVWSRRIGGS
jgi:hypothetical protein